VTGDGEKLGGQRKRVSIKPLTSIFNGISRKTKYYTRNDGVQLRKGDAVLTMPLATTSLNWNRRVRGLTVHGGNLKNKKVRSGEGTTADVKKQGSHTVRDSKKVGNSADSIGGGLKGIGMFGNQLLVSGNKSEGDEMAKGAPMGAE